MRVHLTLLRSGSRVILANSTFRKRRLLRWRLLGGTFTVLGGMATYHYWTAGPTQRRQMLVATEGVIRFIRCISVGLIISLDYWWTLRGLDEDSAAYESAIEPCHQRSADRIVAGALRNGGLYIKLGQGLGSFNQVLPRQYIDTLKSLQDKALARKFNELELLFQEDFNCSPSNLFRSFEREPVAAASLAQVFRAVTQEGLEVAVKAQYIDLRDRYNGDIWTVKVLLKMVAFIHPKFSLSWIFEELRETLAEELDFEHEAHNQERCAHDMVGFPFVYVPKVHWGLTSKRVLTAEWIDGCRVTDKTAVLNMGLNLADVAGKVISAFSHQLFVTGFVHGDPHPGNVLIRASPRGGAEVVILDHGLYMHVEESMRVSLCKIWKSIIKHDITTLQQECSALGVKDYNLLSVMLTGRALSSHRRLFGISSTLTQEDWNAVKNTFSRFDEVMSILRVLPSSMLLVIRNINIVRSVNRELGIPVNRFNIMSKSAIHGSRLSTDPHKRTFTNWIKTWTESLAFDFRLLWISLKLWLSVQYLHALRLWGKLTPALELELEQSMRA